MANSDQNCEHSKEHHHQQQQQQQQQQTCNHLALVQSDCLQNDAHGAKVETVDEGDQCKPDQQQSTSHHPTNTSSKVVVFKSHFPALENNKTIDLDNSDCGVKRSVEKDDSINCAIVGAYHVTRTIRLGSADDSFIYDQNKSTVYDYLASSFNSTQGPIVRSNSFTHQDVGRHRKNIQASFASGLVTNEEDEDLLPFQGARRLSKSLPELNQLRLFPHFVEAANQYNVIFESDQDEDDEDNISSCIATDTEYQPAWANKSDFFLSVLGFSLAINTFWRLPYFAYLNEGGSFLMAYTILMLSIGLPLLCMEYAIGQLTHRNLIVFAHLCPLTKGIVISLALTTSILIPLYSTINTWSILYFFKSFHQTPPWTRCNNKWNVEPCQLNDGPLFTPTTNIENTRTMLNSSHLATSGNLLQSEHSKMTDTFNLTHDHGAINVSNQATMNESSVIHTINLSISITPSSSLSSSPISSQYASQQFFDNRLLNFDFNASFLGMIRWDFAITLFFIWFIVFITLRKPYIFSSNPTFCLAIVPTTVFGVLFFKSIFLPGSQKGLIYFFKPTWEGISQPAIWLYATGFTIHSLGSITGLSLGMAKYHRDRNNLMRDSILACFMNFLIVYFVGSIYFSTIGHLAYKRQVDITQVISKEPGLGFVVMSELLSLMPMRTLWSCCFFFLMFCLGMDYQIATVSTIVDCIKDFWRSRFQTKISHQFVVFMVSVVFFCLSLLFLTQKGIVFVRVTEHFITVILTTILALLEVLLVSNFYGAKNMVNAIRLITYKAPGFYFSFCWKFLTPCALMIILVCNLYYFEEVGFRGSKDLFMVDILGPLITMVILIPIPLLAFHELRRKEADSSGFLKRLNLAFQPTNDPISEIKRENVGNKRQNSDDSNSRGNLSCDINPVISYPLLHSLNRETTV
ncbi:sodium- and chloride-dependent betaine transporter [Tetranychus urticae]|nr:sodium- and chloride-dependent betaine transporter [Tetranychus urticae]XP_015785208.1 sodium- and chloride-dependent betaine transporter [Tetranychus urticae]XP_015785209.1 sodium- and chloride-dependent betaine transporter [Tetranychus urticae]XP_015785210.1 sodium- and chloride-dependent betaine transporter [Tetranychus urticae]XP_015785211.1 sodium- and chloride-dependent betaine transporter [Tetranychus urticae]XP_025016626.1 sodium- and chloride-dependent betaine transporter [Tetranyc